MMVEEKDPKLPVKAENISTDGVIKMIRNLTTPYVLSEDEIADRKDFKIPPAQAMVASGGRANDYLARAGSEQRFFRYIDCELIETTIDGGDVEDTYDLVLKQLHLEEEETLTRILAELEDNNLILKQFDCDGEVFPGREEDVATAKLKVEELTKEYDELRPILTKKRKEFEKHVIDMPVGTILFMSVQNAEKLYPVIVIEEENMKWVETMYEDMPNGRVNGGMHPLGFKLPLRNCCDGQLYLPVGMRDDILPNDFTKSFSETDTLLIES